MDNYTHIQRKLNRFVKKYYTNTLLKGLLLFLSFGAVFFILFLGVEYFLWLGSTGRFILLSLLILVEVFLLIRFIITPLFYLFRIKKGLTTKQASKIIGNHFSEVDDKLINLLDLADNKEHSDLLLASIEQRSITLGSFNFSKAIKYREGLQKAKYLVGPLVLVLLVWFSGNFNSFFGSYDRVLNYRLAYERPAPFSFELLSNDLEVYKNNNYSISVGIVGDIRPDLVYISIEGQEYLMNNNNGVFSYTIKSPSESLSFNFKANDIESKSYDLTVIETPSILDFKLFLDYPKHTGLTNEVLKSVGTATIPEGTKVTWQINAEYTNKIHLKTNDTVLLFDSKEDHFSLTKNIYTDFDYQISTSNAKVPIFENLSYSFKVVKDAYPTIAVSQVLDSLHPNTSYYIGDISDDYGLERVYLYYYDADSPDNVQRIRLLNTNTVVDRFYYTFPSGLTLEADKNYSFYFQVSDNDVVNNKKSTKSQVFKTTILDNNKILEKNLNNQQALLSDFDKSIDKLKKQSTSLKNISNEQKEKESLNFNDKKKVRNFLEQQELQEAQMEKFSKQLKDNLSKFNKEDELNKLLQERLERQEKQAQKNQKLLEDLQKISDKINKEELARKLDEIAKNQKNGQRNLEQLLELTKRYYVTEKASQLAKDLEKLSNKQLLLSDLKLLERDSKKNQADLNNDFNKLDKQLEELAKDNKHLKKPLAIDIDKNKTESIKSDQKDALEQLNKEQDPAQTSQGSDAKSAPNQATKKQKSAADKMMELSQKLAQSSSSSSSSTATEDAEILRQILDNLIVFTFKQEGLMNTFGKNENTFSNQSQAILKQQEYKSLFEHIDDSLFTLSLRVPEISEEINEQVTEIFYNIDKAIDNISDSRLYQGVSYQQYVLTSGNTLSDLLATILDNMQQNMKPGKGSGDGQDFQLPDIIQSQSELGEQIEKQGKGSNSDSGKEGKEGQKGEEQRANGDSGKNGTSGQDGQQSGSGSKSGDKGKNGAGKQGGENGSQGEKGTSGTSGISESELKEIYEIYKQQEAIKQGLEHQLQNMLKSSDRKFTEKLIQQMSEFQDNLLENGITRNTIDKATLIQYELLKLEGAAMQQGKKQERESNTSNQFFDNPITTKPKALDIYKNENEILNRQALPLQQNYQIRIKDYFKKND